MANYDTGGRGGAELTTPVQLIKTVAAVGTPEALAAVGTYFQYASIFGKKAARTDNAGVVYLGTTSANDTQGIAIGVGSLLSIEAPPKQKYDLGTFYLDVVTAGDGVVVVYS